MTVAVTALLLIAALIHASWNAFIKGARDPVAMAAVIYGSEAMLMVPALYMIGWDYQQLVRRLRGKPTDGQTVGESGPPGASEAV